MAASGHVCPAKWAVALADPQGISDDAWTFIYANTALYAAIAYVEQTDAVLSEYAKVSVAPADQLSEQLIFEVRGSQVPQYEATQFIQF